MTEYNHPKKLPPGSVVIAYLRDSGGPEQDESIGQQERVILEYCKQNKLILQKVYAETGSGRNAKKREQFLQMFNDVLRTPDDLRPQGLLLWSLSRFSRDVNDFNHFFFGLIREGIIIHSISDGEIPDGMAGSVLLSLKAYSNADFSEQLGKAIKRGIADRVKQGFNNGGQAPRGYKVVREQQENKRRNGAERVGLRWIVDDELAPLVRLAWELRAQGKSYAHITKATGGKIYSVVNSWTTHFRNKSYLGIGKAGDLEIPDHHEPIITWELWEAVRRVERAARAKGDLLHPRRISNPSLLSGLSFCLYCGASMVLHKSKDYSSYQCGTKDRRLGYQVCTQARGVNARKADKTIFDVVLNRILSPAFVESLLDQIRDQLTDGENLDQEIGVVNNLLTKTERSIQRLIRLAEDTGEIEQVSERIKQLKREQAEQTARIKILKSEREKEIPQITPEALALVFSDWRTRIEQARQRGDILAAKRLIAQIVSKIELAYDRAVIHYSYPLAIPSLEVDSLCAHKITSLLARYLFPI